MSEYSYDRREARSVQHPEFRKLDEARKRVEIAVQDYKKIWVGVRDKVGENLLSVSRYGDIPIVTWQHL